MIVEHEKLETIRQVLARRDCLEAEEIDDAIAEARDRIDAGEDPEEVLAEEFGLEPDYIWDDELGVFK